MVRVGGRVAQMGSAGPFHAKGSLCLGISWDPMNNGVLTTHNNVRRWNPIMLLLMHIPLVVVGIVNYSWRCE